MLLAQPITFAVTGTTLASAQLPVGIYYVTSDVDCYIRQGASGVVATTASNPLWSKSYLRIRVTNETLDGYIAAIRASTSGTVSIIKVPD